MAEIDVAEKVARRLEGKKLFTFRAKETVYYEADIEAEDEDKAREIWHRMDLNQYIVHGENFETYEVICHDGEEE